MLVNLRGEIEVDVTDEQMIVLLKKKREELLCSHEYSEEEEEEKSYYLWKKIEDETDSEKIQYVKGTQISKKHHDMLEMLTKILYTYNMYINEKKRIEEEAEYFRLKAKRANQKNIY